MTWPQQQHLSASVARQVPELAVEIPVNAIGKDYFANESMVEGAPSDTGYQVSLYGLLGLLVARDGSQPARILLRYRPLGPAIKLPFIGRIGFSLDRPAPRPR